MKKKMIALLVGLTVLLVASTALAHELWIEIDYINGKLQADVSWGHVNEFYDPLNHEAVKLFVRYPNGQTEELKLQEAGDQARGSVTAKDKGEYVFWAMRNPSTFSPSDDVTRLSMQMAKTVFVHGEGPATSNAATALPLEIIPDAKLAGATVGGTFSGRALLEGQPFAGATVAIYGPDDDGDTAKMATTGADGRINFSMPESGQWLVKVSGRVEEAGTLGDTAYNEVSRASTLYFNVVGKTAAAPAAPAAAQPAATDRELPRTGSTHILFYGLGALAIGAGLLIRRSK